MARSRISEHDRRTNILDSTWKLIARDGLSATSMRALAAEAGYANGALAYYFEGKDDLMRAALEYVLHATNRRIAAATSGLRGLTALRAFCKEIVPDDELKLLEARVVLPFWSAAITNPAFAGLHADAMSEWRKQLRKYLAQAVSLGELRRPEEPREHADVAETLATMMDGMQVRAVLLPKHHTPRVMWKMIDDCLQRLSPPDAQRDSKRRPRRPSDTSARVRLRSAT